MGFFDDDTRGKRTLGIRDKQILYRNAKGRCENPTCVKKIDFDEMESGHKTAYSKGGNATLKNSVCLCHRCNKLQGNDSWTTFLKKQGITIPNPQAEMKASIKASLMKLKVDELKQLARKHDVTVKGRIVEGFFTDKVKAPTKSQYVNKLSTIVTEKELKTIAKAKPQTLKK